MAPDSHTAALTVGIKHAKDFDNVDMSVVQVHVKAGI